MTKISRNILKAWVGPLFRRRDPEAVHPQLAQKMDQAIEQIHAIQAEARKGSAEEAAMPHWPVLIVRTPKGWTGPKVWDGEPIEGASVPTKYRSRSMRNIWNTWML